MATSSRQLPWSPEPRKEAGPELRVKGRILEKVHADLKSEASESHVPLRAIALPEEGGIPFPLPPQQDTHPTSHLAHTNQRTSRLESQRLKLETNTAVFPPSQGNPVQRPQDLLDQ